MMIDYLSTVACSGKTRQHSAPENYYTVGRVGPGSGGGRALDYQLVSVEEIVGRTSRWGLVVQHHVYFAWGSTYFSGSQAYDLWG